MWLCFPFFSFYVGFLCIHLWWPLLLYLGNIFCSWFKPLLSSGSWLNVLSWLCPPAVPCYTSGWRFPRRGCFLHAGEPSPSHVSTEICTFPPRQLAKSSGNLLLPSHEMKRGCAESPFPGPTGKVLSAQARCQMLMGRGNTEAPKCSPGSTGGV